MSIKDNKENRKPVFATCLNCIDGRTHLPFIKWITDQYGFDHVDLITQPGMVGVMAGENNPAEKHILKNVSTSIAKHNTNTIFITAHYDCAGNPVSDEEQKNQLKTASKKLKALYPSHKVCGLWLDQNGKVSQVTVSDSI